MAGIKCLGHVGLYADDMARMRDFYTRVLGLTVTDENDEVGLTFFSARPQEEHHEMVLQRRGDRPKSNAQQVSWEVDSLDNLLSIYRRLQEEGIRFEQIVTHGIAFGVYFYDPEDNRTEVYWHTGKDVPQPFRKDINLDQPVDQILADAERLSREFSAGYDRVVIR